jgi:hypothetical protein
MPRRIADSVPAIVRKPVPPPSEHVCQFPARDRMGRDRGRYWTCPECKRVWMPVGSLNPMKDGLTAHWAEMTRFCRFDLGATHCNLPKDHDGRHDPAPIHDPSSHDPDWAIHRVES